MTVKKNKITYNENHPTTLYAHAIVSGEFPVCEAEKLLATKHLKDLVRQGTKRFPYVFDESRADRFFYFYNICKNPDTLQYYQILPHQKFDYGMQYGWVHKDTGYRKYSTIYCQQARGNIKTTGCAIEALYALTSDKVYKPGFPELGYIIRNAEIHLMAVDTTQAEELREPIVLISQSSPKLITRVKALKSYIHGIKYGGKVRVLSKELKNKQGGKPNFVIIDEYSSHSNHKRREAAGKGLGKKIQSTLKIITTPGDDEQNNPAKKEYIYAIKVLKGKVIDENYLPIIRELEFSDDIHDSSIWSKASPVFRYTGKYEYSDILFEAVKKDYKRAFEGKDADLQRDFKIYRLGLWQEKSVKSFLSSEDLAFYDSLAVSEEEFDNLTYGLQKNVGCDLSKRIDLTATGDAFILNDGRIAINAKGYIIEKTAYQRAKIENIPYFDWIEKGYVMAMDTPVINTDIVAEDIILTADLKEHKIMEFTYDPFGAYQMVSNFMEGKYDGFRYQGVEIPQTIIHLHKPTELLKTLILERKLVHNGNPLLRWALENAYEIKSRQGDLIRLSKENPDSPKRIDPAAAVINALARINTLESISWVNKIVEGASLF